jgi:imidazolonepropionase-like amidohydrolase
MRTHQTLTLSLALTATILPAIIGWHRTENGTLAIQGATIYVSPDKAPIAGGTVLVRDGRIAAVGPKVSVPMGTRIIPCDHCVVTAGFWNAHIHLTEPIWANAATASAASLDSALAAMLTRWGFTTVVDIGSDLRTTLALRRRITSGEVIGPRIYTAGSGLFPPNGIPFYLANLPAAIRSQIPEPATPAEAAAYVTQNIANGADVTKLFTGSLISPRQVLPMPEPIARAAVEASHAKHELVFAHPSNLEGMQVAINSGVDILAHAPSSPRGVDSAVLASVIARHMAMIPTLKMFATTVTTDTAWLNPIYSVVRRFHAMGGQFIFGTDVGYMTDYSTEDEFRALAISGLSWRDMLRMLTTAPAERFGVAKDTGTIEPGKTGDLVILSADPASDVTAFSKVVATIRNGEVIYSRP